VSFPEVQEELDPGFRRDDEQICFGPFLREPKLREDGARIVNKARAN